MPSNTIVLGGALVILSLLLCIVVIVLCTCQHYLEPFRYTEDMIIRGKDYEDFQAKYYEEEEEERPREPPQRPSRRNIPSRRPPPDDWSRSRYAVVDALV